MAQSLADLAREQAERKKKEAAANPAVEGLKAASPPPPTTVTIIGGGKTPEQLKREADAKAHATAVEQQRAKTQAKKQAATGSLR